MVRVRRSLFLSSMFFLSLMLVLVLAVGQARATSCCVGGVPNGVKEPGEVCDLGLANKDDCCDDECHFVATNTLCDDGDRCTQNERCDAAGRCRSGTPWYEPTCVSGTPNGDRTDCEQCDGGANNPSDCCDENCHAEPQNRTCDDGDPCTVGERCDAIARCRSGVRTSLRCEGETGLQNGVVSGCELCDNNDPYNQTDCCDDNCNFVPRQTICDDGDPCTSGTTCDSDGDCSSGTDLYSTTCFGGSPNGIIDHPPGSCGEQCDGGANNPNDCCNENCRFESNSHACSDNDPCTSGEHCDRDGDCRFGTGDYLTTCVGGAPNGIIESTLNGCEQCDGGLSTTDCCDGTCHYAASGTICDDGNPCTSSSTCDRDGDCRFGGAYTGGCDGGAPNGVRTGCEQCDRGMNPDDCCTDDCAFVTEGSRCDEDIDCTVKSTCDSDGDCRFGQAEECTTPCSSDGNICTFDYCIGKVCTHNQSRSCQNGLENTNGTTCEDGNACTNSVCSNGSCSSTVSCKQGGAVCQVCGTLCGTALPKCSCSP